MPDLCGRRLSVNEVISASGQVTRHDREGRRLEESPANRTGVCRKESLAPGLAICSGLVIGPGLALTRANSQHANTAVTSQPAPVYGDLMTADSGQRDSGQRHAFDGSVVARWGALALLVRPAYIATEFVVAAATKGGYSFFSDSVSKLGEIGCSVAYCSPRHGLMNGSFMTFGALLTGGAALLVRPLGPWVTGLLVVSGLSSVATGLAPLDQDATLHAVAATPLFVAQPLALILLGARLRKDRPRLAWPLLVTGAVTAAAALGFILSGQDALSGGFERLALWPVMVALAGYGCSLLAHV